MRNCYFDLATRAIIDLNEVPPSWGDAPSKTWRISRVNTPARYRNQGLATTLMKELLYDADREGIILTLEPLPDGSEGALKLRQLKRFYRKHGFVQQKDKTMLRVPRKQTSKRWTGDCPE